MTSQFYKNSLTAITLCLTATSASAQNITPESIAKQFSAENLEYSAVKLKAGIRNEIEYNDNIFRSPSDEEDDVILRFIPKVSVESDLERHAIGLDARLEQGIYLENSENNYTDVKIDLIGQYDFNELNALHVGAGYEREHIDIGAFIDDPESALTEPVTFDVFKGNIDYKTQFNLFNYAAGIKATNFDFDNVEALDGDISIQDDRDLSLIHISEPTRPY